MSHSNPLGTVSVPDVPVCDEDSPLYFINRLLVDAVAANPGITCVKISVPTGEYPHNVTYLFSVELKPGIDFSNECFIGPVNVINPRNSFVPREAIVRQVRLGCAAKAYCLEIGRGWRTGYVHIGEIRIVA